MTQVHGGGGAIGTPVPVADSQRPRSQPVMLPPQPWPPGAGVLIVQATYHWLAMFMIVPPTLTLNGHPVGARWGQNAYLLPPGEHHVELSIRGLFKLGATAAVVPVQSGQQTVVHYAPPLTAFSRGAMGPTPQTSRGVAGFVALLGIPLGLALLTVILAIVGAAVS